ncbi:hypothetical protein [Roseovarius sp.]|uniref:hypothetical protein n=1 Tax=Roseovarius sp. TaxID=1486281 RepID=UPI003561F0B4
MKIATSIIATLFAGALMIPLSGCDDQGPMEEAGEKIDETVEDAGDSIEETTDGG